VEKILAMKSNSFTAAAAVCALLLTSAWFSEGWLQPDEHYRVLEAAHQLVYGYATLPWELTDKPPIATYLLAVLHTPIIWMGDTLGLSGSTEAALARMFSALVAATRIPAFYYTLQFWGLKKERWFLYTLITFFAGFGPFIMVRTSQENWAATALCWTLFFLAKASQESRGQSEGESAKSRSFLQPFLFGVFLSLCVSFRFQMGPSMFALALTSFWFLGLPRTFIAGLGAMCGLIPMALVDYFITGQPFSAAIGNFQYGAKYNELAHMWGIQPWWFYLVLYFTVWFPPLSIALFPLTVVGIFKRLALCAVMIPFIFVHSQSLHKEARYALPVLTLIFVSTFVGYEWAEGRPELRRLFENLARVPKKVFYGLLVFLAAIGLVLSMRPQSRVQRAYERAFALWNSGELSKNFIFVADSALDISKFYFKERDFTPRKISSEDFLRLLVDNDGRPPSGDFVLSRIDLKIVKQAEQVCQVLYSSASPLERRLLEFSEKVPRRKRLDVILRCN
jgi:hypothetical protein